MKESFYFPHDNNAHNDPKIMWMLMSMWLASIWIYWIIIEIMHQQKDWILNEDEFKNYIQFYSVKENSTFVEDMLNKFETTWIFCFEDWKVFSNRVLKNKEYRSDLKEKRSNAWKKSAEKRALQRQESTSVEQNSTSDEQWKEKKGNKKEKEIEIEIKHKYWEYLNILLLDKEKEKIINDYSQEIFDKYIIILSEWIKMKWYKYQDHNLALRNWIRKDHQKKDEWKKWFEKTGKTNFSEWL